MKTKYQHILQLTIISIFSTILLWLPFYLKLPSFWNIPLSSDGMATVVRNYDGPYYLVVAKSLYNADIIKQFEFDEPVEYYAAHYPLYPILMKPLATFLGFPYSMLGITLLSSIASVIIFYLLLTQLKIPNPYWISVISLFLPARWLITRSIGTPEPLFIALTLFSILSFYKKQYWRAGIAGALAQLTKPPGILLFVAYGLTLLWPQLKKLPTTKLSTWIKQLPWKTYPLTLIPLALILLFTFYSQIYGSFFAWFESGDNIHLFWPPFQMFNTAAAWVGTFWLEDIIWLLLIGATAVVINWKRQDIISWFTAIYFISIIFISHRDLSRYALPLAPFFLIAFAPYLNTKQFRLVFYFILLPIFLYSLNFIAGNTTPISDWTQLL